MSRYSLTTLLIAWCGSVALGLWCMLDYERTPAATIAAAAAWPADSRLVRDPDRPTLVMFVHPHCPCSRASLHELAALASQCGERVALRIVFVTPPGVAEGWERTDLYDAASRIPGAQVCRDRDGVEAARFGATTSGESLLYAADARLLFHGGLTGSRGHEGDNAGRDAVTALVETGRAEQRSSAVYGCGLLNQCRQREEAGSLWKP